LQLAHAVLARGPRKTSRYGAGPSDHGFVSAGNDTGLDTVMIEAALASRGIIS
jgi:hypothetical protein